MEIIPFNLNDYVLVRLTDRGRQIHKQQHDALMAKFPIGARWDYNKPKEDADGWSEWQLWDLMSQFGEYLYNGCIVPFDTTIRFRKE